MPSLVIEYPRDRDSVPVHPLRFSSAGLDRNAHVSTRRTPAGVIAARWLAVVALCLFVMIGQKSLGQTITLSSPASGTTYVDNIPFVRTISGEAGGGISSVKLICTYTGGHSTASIGTVWTLTLVSVATSQSLSFNPSTVTSSSLFSNVSPFTAMPDGVYSIYAEYVRVPSGTVIRSSPTLTNVSTDTYAIPPLFTYSPPVTIDLATDVVNLSNHALAANAAVTISGTNLSSATTFYVSLIDSGGFKLTTTPGGSSFVDFTSAASPAVTYPQMSSNVATLGTSTFSFMFTLGESFAGGSAKLVFTGKTTGTVTVTLVNLVRTGRVVFDRTNVAGPGIASSTSPTIPDDTYSVSLTYRDLNGHTSTAATLNHLLLDAGTQTPSFTSLVDGAAITEGSTIPYTLPEAPFGGTVKLTFSNGTTTTVIPLTNATSGTFIYNRSLHAATIPTGTYTVVLSCQDLAGNPVASKIVTGVAVTVVPFSNTDDTDGDGLNDAAEVQLASLGFNWQVSQTALVNAYLSNTALYTQTQMNTNRVAGQADVTSNPAAYSLYSLSQLQALNVGTPLIVKDTATGKWKLTVALQKSTDLTNYSAFAFIPSETSVNASGQVEFLFTVPETNAFFRLNTF